MKKYLLITAVLAVMMMPNTSFAADDCNDPVADWQTKDTLRQKLEAKGWKIQRIKVDDGCYEVKAYDQHGNKLKAEYFPASLRLRKLEVKFEKDAIIPKEFYRID